MPFCQWFCSYRRGWPLLALYLGLFGKYAGLEVPGLLQGEFLVEGSNCSSPGHALCLRNSVLSEETTEGDMDSQQPLCTEEGFLTDLQVETRVEGNDL